MDEDLLPGTGDEQPSGFDIVLRGYDRRQVDDYLDRVEVALQQADARHAHDSGRVGELEAALADLRDRLAAAERRAEGRPEPASVVGDRLATMLRLAEEEAEQLVEQARSRAAEQTAQRAADLDAREAELRERLAEVDRATVQAQQDAEAIRAAARADAERLRAEAEEAARASAAGIDDEVRQLREEGRREAAAMTAEARRQVEELSRQRDAIAAQLQSLRDTLAGAVAPLSPGDQPTQAVPLPTERRPDGA